MKKTRNLVFLGLLIAMEITFTRFFAFQTLTIRIGFGFIPLSLTSMFFGPIIGGIASMLSDIVGMIIAPRGAYFPGFTLSALLTGVIYGLMLYKKPKTIFRVALSVLIITLFIDLGLNTLWIYMTTGRAAVVLLMERALKSAVLFPVQVIMITAVWNYVGRFVENNFLKSEKTT
ncbi:MAG: folate family ECF transporter S component [Acetivibrionales bacterium]|jgi:ECF transporter S component (folate family)